MDLINRKTAAALLGALLVQLLILGLFASPSITPAQATEPTPTPQAAPPCRLADERDCVMINPRQLVPQLAQPRQHPAMGATNVPTFTLVSATMPQPLEPQSVTPNTFFVTDGSTRLPGDVRYLASSRMVVFQPASPLQAGARYTATVTSQMRHAADGSPVQPIVWSFTTAAPVERLVQDDVTAAASRRSVGGLNIYFGDLHAHTNYSDGKGGAPVDAFLSARASGMDFYAVTDHGFLLTDAEWQSLKTAALTTTIEGQFIGLAGYEYTHVEGHLNVFDTEFLAHRDDPNYASLDDFYAWLVAHPTAFAQFNHPGHGNNGNFRNFAHDPVVDQKIVLQELNTSYQFLLAMRSGWRLGTLVNTDTHQPNWGCCRLMGVLAPALTRASILEAIKARRTFFVSPHDPDFVVVMRANGSWMGSSVSNPSVINFTINVFDENPAGAPVRINLYENGNRIASTSQSSRDVYSWTPSVPTRLGNFYYVEAYYDGWIYPAYSSPIWVEQAPLAEAGPGQVVIAGAPFKLDASQSWDPDGDALAYRWTQLSGPTASVGHSHPLQPGADFMAPTTPGDIQFQLSVKDPGGLAASDTVQITVTDQPYLQIGKQGPQKTLPGELINYTLTVTNIGPTDAVDVTVTDALPTGATYVSGGTLQANNIVAWNVPSLAANGGTAQVFLTVAADGAVINRDYGASCPTCIPATGEIAVLTNPRSTYLPLISQGK